jgi:hypothetical protein
MSGQIHVASVSVQFHELESASNGFASTGSGATEWMAALVRPAGDEVDVCRPHSKGVGSAFQARAVDSNHSTTLRSWPASDQPVHVLQ